MGALLSLPITLLNALLPFTKPGTPLLQDLVHTAILCGTLYFAPQIAEWYNSRQAQDPLHEPAGTDDTRQPAAEAPGDIPHREEEDEEEALLDERLVLQDDGEEVVGPPPPLAPTPPLFNRAAQHPPGPRVDNAADFPDAFAAEAAGPAHNNQNGPRATPANRTVGAKKAKSLARKDQRRAYHEFHRQEAELRRLQQAEGAEEREAALAAERERRARIEEEIRERERVERDQAKWDREREAEEENARRERVVGRVREEMQRGAVDLVDVAWAEGKDRVWVERLVRASGLLSQLQKDGAHVMITGHGWLVRLDAELMKQAYADAEVYGERNGGKVSFTEFGGILEKAVLGRAKA